MSHLSDISHPYGIARAARSTRPGPAIEGVKRTFFGKKSIIFPNLISFRGKTRSRKEII